jgi:hypothetical protein
MRVHPRSIQPSAPPLHDTESEAPEKRPFSVSPEK